MAASEGQQLISSLPHNPGTCTEFVNVQWQGDPCIPVQVGLHQPQCLPAADAEQGRAFLLLLPCCLSQGLLRGGQQLG